MPTIRRSQSTKVSAPMIPIKTLLRASWQDFCRDWKETFVISRWLMLPALLVLLSAVMSRIMPSDNDNLFAILALVAALVVDGWVNVQLIQHALRKEELLKTPSATPWTRQVLAYFWLKLISGIALLGALLPAILGVIGSPLFISRSALPQLTASALISGAILVLSLPGIWLSLMLIFAPFLLFQDPQGVDNTFTLYRGLRLPSIKNAVAWLAQSYQLVRGRFWPTCIRLVVPGLIFGLLIIASISLAAVLIELIAGTKKIEALFGPGVTLTDVNSSSSNSYTFFLQSIGQAVFLPLLIIWQVKLYRALKET